MHRLREILAHDGIAVLAVIFALGAAVLSLANALSQEAVSAIEQHAREDDLHFKSSTHASTTRTCCKRS